LFFNVTKPGVRHTKNHCKNSVTKAAVVLNAMTASGMSDMVDVMPFRCTN
jgi:hypothetical protein